jgi:hypothetical protein
MAIRFRKSIKLAPGIRMNFSGSGASWTVGPRGASIGIGKRGAYLNSGIPGTGLYARQRLDSGGTTSREPPGSTGTIAITVSISDDGALTFKDSQGNLIPEHQIDAVKKQQGDKIKGLIQTKCDEVNDRVQSLGRLHEDTSPPYAHQFETPRFSEPKPVPPIPKVPGFFCKLFKSCVAKVEDANRLAAERFQAGLDEWTQKKAAFEQQVEADRDFINRVNAGDLAAVEQYFEAVLQDITWPQETLVAFDVRQDKTIAIDVDLPEIEAMPNKTASVPQRGYKLSIKEMGPTQIQKLYMRHVHGIGFRLAGEAFAASPVIEQVVLSAYSQRPNKATGQIGDEYLYSVRISRQDWKEINFANLEQLDVVEAFSRFELRRDMTKTGIFKPIDPFDGGPT